MTVRNRPRRSLERSVLAVVGVGVVTATALSVNVVGAPTGSAARAVMVSRGGVSSGDTASTSQAELMSAAELSAPAAATEAPAGATTPPMAHATRKPESTTTGSTGRARSTAATSGSAGTDRTSAGRGSRHRHGSGQCDRCGRDDGQWHGGHHHRF